MSEELREHLRKTLRTAGFIDPDDGTVPMWPSEDGPVWVSWRRLVDAIIANMPEDRITLEMRGRHVVELRTRIGELEEDLAWERDRKG